MQTQKFGPYYNPVVNSNLLVLSDQTKIESIWPTFCEATKTAKAFRVHQKRRSLLLFYEIVFCLAGLVVDLR